MRKSMVLATFVLVVWQLQCAYSATIRNLPPTIAETGFPILVADADIKSLEDDSEQDEKPMLLLFPINLSEQNDDCQSDESTSEESEITHEPKKTSARSGKTKRGQSFNPVRTIRRTSFTQNPLQKYTSLASECPTDGSLENAMAKKSFDCRVATIKDARKIFQNLLKSHSTKRKNEDATSEQLSESCDQDSISFVSKNSAKKLVDKTAPKKYVCYCIEEKCVTKKKPWKKPIKKIIHPQSMKNRMGPNILSRLSHSSYDENSEGISGPVPSDYAIGAPESLQCPPGAVLIEEPEYFAQSSTKHRKQQPLHRRRPSNKWAKKMLSCHSETLIPANPTKNHVQMVGKRKFNDRRICKIDRKSSIPHKAELAIENNENADQLSVEELEPSVNHVQHHQYNYNNGQIDLNQFNPVPMVAPNLYSGLPVFYPQHPQYPDYDDSSLIGDRQIPLEPPTLIGHQDPIHDPHMETQIETNFSSMDECIKLYGANFCVGNLPTVSSVYGDQEAMSREVETEDPHVVDQWKQANYGILRNANSGTSIYSTVDSNREEQSRHFDEYDNSMEDSQKFESDDDFVSSAKSNKNTVFQKMVEEDIEEFPQIERTRIPENFQGAHGLSASQYLEYGLKSKEEGAGGSSRLEDLEESTERSLEYVRTSQDSKSTRPDSEESDEFITNSPPAVFVKMNKIRGQAGNNLQEKISHRSESRFSDWEQDTTPVNLLPEEKSPSHMTTFGIYSSPSDFTGRIHESSELKETNIEEAPNQFDYSLQSQRQEDDDNLDSTTERVFDQQLGNPYESTLVDDPEQLEQPETNPEITDADSSPRVAEEIVATFHNPAESESSSNAENAGIFPQEADEVEETTPASYFPDSQTTGTEDVQLNPTRMQGITDHHIDGIEETTASLYNTPVSEESDEDENELSEVAEVASPRREFDGTAESPSIDDEEIYEGDVNASDSIVGGSRHAFADVTLNDTEYPEEAVSETTVPGHDVSPPWIHEDGDQLEDDVGKTSQSLYHSTPIEIQEPDTGEYVISTDPNWDSNLKQNLPEEITNSPDYEDFENNNYSPPLQSANHLLSSIPRRPSAIDNHPTTTNQEHQESNMSSEDIISDLDEDTTKTIMEDPVVAKNAPTISELDENLDDQFKTPDEALNQFFFPSEADNDEEPNEILKNALKQLSNTFNDGTNFNIEDQYNAYHDSMRHDENIDDATVGDVNGFEAINEPTMEDETILRKPGWQIVSTNHPTPYENVDERSGHDQSSSYEIVGSRNTETKSNSSNHPQREETSSTLGSTEKSPRDEKALRKVIEDVVDDLTSLKSYKQSRNGLLPSDIIEASRDGSLTELSDLSILRNLVLLPEVGHMIIDTVKGKISGSSDVLRDFPLNAFTDSTIYDVLNEVLEDKLMDGSSETENRRNFENLHTPSAPIFAIPKNNYASRKPNVAMITKSIENIVQYPGIGLRAIDLPSGRKIIVRALANALERLNYSVDNSVIEIAMDNFIARNLRSRIASLRNSASAKSNLGFFDNDLSDLAVKDIPVISVTERFVDDGRWSEKETIVGNSRKNFGTSSSINFATDERFDDSISNSDASSIWDNQFDYAVKAADYQISGESEADDGFTKENHATNAIVAMNKNIPTDAESHRDHEGIDNEPIKYYSPNAKLLSYKKNHLNSAAILESQRKFQNVVHSLNIDESMKDCRKSMEVGSKEFDEPKRSDDYKFLIKSEESKLDPIGKSITCTCEETGASDLGIYDRTSSDEDRKSYLPINRHHFNDSGKSNYGNYDGTENSLAGFEPKIDCGEQFIDTESSEISSNIDNSNVDDRIDDDCSSEDYSSNRNPSSTEKLQQNIESDENGKADSNYEDFETLNVTPDSYDFDDTFDVEEPNKNKPYRVESAFQNFVGASAKKIQSPEDESTSRGTIEESSENFYVGAENPTTGKFVENSEEESSKEITKTEGLHYSNDGSEVTLGSLHHGQTDESINDRIRDDRPTFVKKRPENRAEGKIQNLRHELSEARRRQQSNYLTTAAISSESQENMKNPKSSRFSSFENHFNDEKNYPLYDEFTTENYRKLENALMPKGVEEDSVEDSEGIKSSESTSNVDDEVLQNDGNSDYDVSSEYNNYDVPIATTLNYYHSIKTTRKPFRGSTGQKGHRRPAQFFPNDSTKLFDKNVKQNWISSAPTTPSYDPTYFGRIFPNSGNSRDDGISDLTNMDLFYVGDGVKLPLTIRKMSDGSYALSISEKICENFVKRNCPCCVPRQGDIMTETKISPDSMDDNDYGDEKIWSVDDNFDDSFELPVNTRFREKWMNRHVRSTIGSKIGATSATPVDKFVKKYNLSLNLNSEDPTIKNSRNNEQAEVIKNHATKKRFDYSKNVILSKNFESNKKIERKDVKEIAERIINFANLITPGKKFQTFEIPEINYKTNKNDFPGKILHVEDLPEDERSEIVFKALDELVNSNSNKKSSNKNRYNVGNSLEKGFSKNVDQWRTGSDDYNLDKMENEIAKYGYQKNNPIFKILRSIESQTNSHGRYKYQKDTDHEAEEKMNFLKTLLHWLRRLLLKTESTDDS